MVTPSLTKKRLVYYQPELISLFQRTSVCMTNLAENFGANPYPLLYTDDYGKAIRLAANSGALCSCIEDVKTLSILQLSSSFAGGCIHNSHGVSDLQSTHWQRSLVGAQRR